MNDQSRPIALEKKRLRAAARSKRLKLHKQNGTAGEKAAARFLKHIVMETGNVVAGYWPMESELDPLVLMGALHGASRQCALPRMMDDAERLDFHQWSPGDRLVRGPHNVREPKATAPLVDPAVLLVPLLAFDRLGYRLGHGAGFYDRTLKHLRERCSVMAVGLAFAGQELAFVPRETHDEPLDWIVTELEAIRIER